MALAEQRYSGIFFQVQPAIKKKKRREKEKKRGEKRRERRKREFRIIDIMLENMFLIEITHLECETGKKLVRFLLYGEFTQPFVCYIDCNLKGIVEVPFPTSHHQGYFRPCATTHTGRYATPAALYLLLIYPHYIWNFI